MNTLVWRFRHYSGASFTPGAPLHSTCLGSPEFYRRNEGDGWLGSKFNVPLVFVRGASYETSQNKRKHKWTFDASVTFHITRYRCNYVFLFLYRISFVSVSRFFYFRGFRPWFFYLIFLSGGWARVFFYLSKFIVSCCAFSSDDPTDHFLWSCSKGIVCSRQPERDYQYLVLCILMVLVLFKFLHL